jgi:hypothetical protein
MGSTICRLAVGIGCFPPYLEVVVSIPNPRVLHDKGHTLPHYVREQRQMQRCKHIHISEIYRFILGATRQRSWLRHYATSRKVTSSIPDEAIGLFQLT